MTVAKDIAPNRILFSMIRVTDLERSVAFYCNLLGMKELERETFPEAEFSISLLGYGDRDQHTALELTWNWQNDGYAHGTAYGNISLGVEDIYVLEAFLKEQGVKILRPAGPMSMVSTEIGRTYTFAHIEDPDGYRVELMQMH